MQDLANKQTIDQLQAAKRGRGRPVSGQAMTNAERQRRYRQNLKSKNRNVTKTKGQEEGIHDDADRQEVGNVLLDRLDQLEQQVAELLMRELLALREVARLQALIASSMPEQLNEIEPRPFNDLPGEWQCNEK